VYKTSTDTAGSKNRSSETYRSFVRGVPNIFNPFDQNALEAALQLKDEQGAKVTLLSMGPPQAVEVLREGTGQWEPMKRICWTEQKSRRFGYPGNRLLPGTGS